MENPTFLNGDLSDIVVERLTPNIELKPNWRHVFL